MRKLDIYVYTHCEGYKGRGDWYADYYCEGQHKTRSGHVKRITAGRLELQAVVAALTSVRKKRDLKIYLHTTSDYVADNMNNGNVKKWRQYNFDIITGYGEWAEPTGKKRPNHDLWKKLLDLAAAKNVTIRELGLIWPELVKYEAADQEVPPDAEAKVSVHSAMPVQNPSERSMWTSIYTSGRAIDNIAGWSFVIQHGPKYWHVATGVLPGGDALHAEMHAAAAAADIVGVRRRTYLRPGSAELRNALVSSTKATSFAGDNQDKLELWTTLMEYIRVRPLNVMRKGNFDNAYSQYCFELCAKAARDQLVVVRHQS